MTDDDFAARSKERAFFYWCGRTAESAARGANLAGMARAWGQPELAMQTAFIVYTALAVGGSLGFLCGALCAAGKAADQGEPR
jgi:hypothetical protein